MGTYGGNAQKVLALVEFDKAVAYLLCLLAGSFLVHLHAYMDEPPCMHRRCKPAASHDSFWKYDSHGRHNLLNCT